MELHGYKCPKCERIFTGRAHTSVGDKENPDCPFCEPGILLEKIES